MNPRRTATALLAASLLGPLCCWAQRQPSSDLPSRRYSISGTVRYAANNGGAEMIRVNLKVLAGGTISTVSTSSNGDFHFPGLVSGNYIITVEEMGYEPIRENVTVYKSPLAGILLLLRNTVQTRPPETGDIVSAREMLIPHDASKAYQKGSEKLSRKDAAGSLPLFHRAIARFPSYYEAYYQIGRAQILLGHTEEGEQAYWKCIELSGGRYAAPYFDLGSLLSDSRKFAEAEAMVRKGLELDTTSWQGHLQLARALLGLNRLDEAERSAQFAIQENASFATAHLLLANIHIRKHNYPALKKELDEYLRLDPNGPMSAQARRTREVVERALAKEQNSSAASPAKP